jgi:RHS repeat-associated protein
MANERERTDQSGQSFGPAAPRAQNGGTASKNKQDNAGPLPALILPKGGGAIRGIGEKFAANPANGTGSLTFPIAISPGRSQFGPQLSLTYDSGAGNGPFGLGWQISSPAITRKTDKGLPQYRDESESDVFILSGAEDLVPVLKETAGEWQRDTQVRGDYEVQRYRPRVEGLFARIERWRNVNTGDVHWRSITRENVTSIYGKDDNSRISDPQGARIFSWLISETYDDRGNAMVYEYKPEDSAGVDLAQAHEANRSETSRRANRYLKRIKYGNRTSRLVQPDLNQMEWLFEVVFDYGEHALDEPLPLETSGWLCREDAFSSYRAGFDVRTYRLCQRILMFHHFPEEENVGRDCLVRSTDFVYRNTRNNDADLKKGHPVASFLAAVSQSGYKRQALGGYLTQSLPPLEFTYSEPVIHEEIHDIDLESLENLPNGLDGTEYQWVDLEGEGVSGILTEQANAWFYKPNLGNAQFGPLQRFGHTPASAALSSGSQQLLNLAGDGQLDLVEFSGWTPGFYERTDQQDWEEFKPFATLPNLNWSDPNLRFVDLTGDGHADILVTEGEVLTWHESLAEDGFGPAQKVRQVLGEDRGARVVFNDGTQSLYLADMSGDGLPDLVRIRNAEICYWPNLGYGQFGEKVTMDHAPWLDHQEQFDQRRVCLADVDGSGNNDLIYLGNDGARIYLNQAGNSFSEPRLLPQFPGLDTFARVTAVDLFGNGTACLVWSSSLPDKRMRFMDLMGGQKPHLLTRIVNNLGAETQVFYTASTEFQQADKQSGKPWITKVPFPVHVVERVETYDHISRSRFVTRYVYHHGFYDGVEREFRGFGMVEQLDTEEFAALGASSVFPAGDNFDQSSHVPPVLTRTWFHTGVYFGRDHVSGFFAGEYYREPGLNETQAKQLLLDDTVLPTGLTAEEEREACRALKGAMLRQEIYALDGTAKEPHPYVVTEQNFIVRRLQPQAGNRHAVFLSHEGESLRYQYERNPSDPRVAHALTLELDDFGNVLKSAEVAYGRRVADPQLETRDQLKQSERHIVYTENQFTNHVDDADDYRTPLESETRTFELTGVELPATRFSVPEILSAAANATAIGYTDTPAPGVLQKRLIEQKRTLYRRNDLAGPLPLGSLESLALIFESYKLAFTPQLLTSVFDDRVSDSMLIEGGFVHSHADQNWWAPSGVIGYSPNTSDSPSQELAFARASFFLPHRYRDPFHTTAASTESFVTYDRYALLPQETRDALDNHITVGERDIDPSLPLIRHGHDYRMLQPSLMMDPNRNRSVVAFDALGMVVGTAVMGKPEDTPAQGDRLDSFVADLSEEEVAKFFADPKGPIAAELLSDATTRVIYDYHAFNREADPTKKSPVVSATLARTRHASDAARDMQIQVSLSYSDGLGREIQQKVQAEPGPIPDSSRKLLLKSIDVNPRWVSSGWIIFNNKGKPVRQYEPFFTATHRFEFNVRVGVSPILFYDPVERVVVTLHPNHTWEKVVFGAWRTETWDVNDTVLVADPTLDVDVAGFFSRLPDDDYLPTWYVLRTDPASASANWPDPKIRDAEKRAAEKTAVHAATPAVAHTDSLQRTFLTVSHNKFKYSDSPPAELPLEEFYATRTVLDIESNERAVVDAKERIVIRADYDLLGNRIHQMSMEAGERWLLNDVLDKPLYVWTSRIQRIRATYDQLRRPVESFLRDSASAEILVGRIKYGESQPKAELNNLRGKEVQVLDQAGVVTNVEYDFKGNLLRSRRQLASVYKTTIDWSDSVALDPAIYHSGFRYDALNRPRQFIAPHSDQPGTTINVIQHSYNEASLLEQVHAWLNIDQEPDGLLDPATANLPAVTNIDYDAKGQRVKIAYGNSVRTGYEYDPFTFRLTHLITARDPASFPDDCTKQASSWPGCNVQNLHYVYDPSGNVTTIYDEAQQAIYFRNKRVEPSSEYTYDATYRLIEGAGREHLGQTGGAPIPHSYNDFPRVGIDWSANDGNAMGAYIERYLYDAAGNFLTMKHQGSDPANPGWTRSYAYQEASLIDPTKPSNRVSTTTIGNSVDRYGYDAHGNITVMPQLRVMRWDFKDQLQMTQRQAVNSGDTDGAQHQGERTYYVYDSSGQRVRKVTETATGQLKTERVYLGIFEIYRRSGLNALTRETLHLMDDQRRIALVETRTQGKETGVPAQVIRFQFTNQLDSAVLELDERAQILSYEEYTPFGSTSYQAVRSVTDVPKRYRYTAKERDEESGLYYMTARYYASWLGRWVSADPKGLVDGPNLYAYVRNNPLMYTDPTGTECDSDKQSCVDPTVQPTPREEGSRQSLPVEQRDLPAQSSEFETEMAAPLLTSLTIAMKASAAPVGASGGALAGPFLTFTGPAAQGAAEAAEAAGQGFTLFRTIYFEQAVTEAEALKKALDLPCLSEEVRRAIFLRLSKVAARDAAVGGRGLTSMNAPGSIPAESIQAAEISTFRFYGAGMGALNVGAGILMLSSIDKDDPELIQTLTFAAGAGSLFGGAASIYGAVTVDAAACAVGGAVSTGAGIVGMPVMWWAAMKHTEKEIALKQRIAEKMRKDGNDNAANLILMAPFNRCSTTYCEPYGY